MDEVNVQAVDGIATIRLYGSSTSMKELKCSIQYAFYTQRGEIVELEQVWDLVVRPAFTSYKIVPLSISPKSESILLNLPPIVLKSASSSFREKLETMEGKVHSLLRSTSTEEMMLVNTAIQPKWNDLLRYNTVNVFAKQPGWRLESAWDGAEVREIAVLNTYKSLGMQSREYLIPDFNEQGELWDVNFGVMEGLYTSIREQGEFTGDWKERQVMLKFLEKYRTAFLTRDLETLNAVFADEALIIVGRKMRPGEAANPYSYQPEGENQPDIEYLKLTKSQYLERQKTLFEQKKDIYLGYSTFQILRKNNQLGVYGISMRQNYQSINYADEGYLFLLVDFNSSEPKIYIRSWQPQEWREDALIKMGNFKVYK